MCPVYKIWARDTSPHEQDHIATTNENPSKASWGCKDEGTSAARKSTPDICSMVVHNFPNKTLIIYRGLHTRTRHTFHKQDCSYCHVVFHQGETRETVAMQSICLTTLVKRSFNYLIKQGLSILLYIACEISTPNRLAKDIQLQLSKSGCVWVCHLQYYTTHQAWLWMKNWNMACHCMCYKPAEYCTDV